MWGGIYAVLFSISTILSYENPILNGFPESVASSYTKHSLSGVEFQNKIVGQEIQYSFYENKKYGPLQRGQSISLTDQGGLWLGYGFIRKLSLSDAFDLNFDFFCKQKPTFDFKQVDFFCTNKCNFLQIIW